MLSELRKLDGEIRVEDIKEIAYKFNIVSLGKSDIVISNEDCKNVLIRSVDHNQLEKDWVILQDICQKYQNRKMDRSINSIKVCRKNKEKYYSYDEILESGLLKIMPNGNIVLLGDLVELLSSIDNYILKFAKSNHATQFYSSPLWKENELNGFGYMKDDLMLYKLNHINDSNNDHYWQMAVCDNIWRYLKDSDIKDSQIFTSIGVCSRREGSQYFILERMKLFHMREVVFIGTSESVQNFRDKMMEFSIKMINDFELDSYIEDANDPFFLNNEDLNCENEYHYPGDVKKELRANLYGKKSLAIASFNIHGDYFTQNLNINSEKHDSLWTTCAAYGIERWVWAVLSQHGPYKKNWPKILI